MSERGIVASEPHLKCCVVGGGPAGIFLGYLLARSGVSVIVLEKHTDFLRDFRGDTIHPSTLQLLDELDLLDDFLPMTDFQSKQLKVSLDGKTLDGPSFAHLRTKCKFVGFVPQWDFLNLLSDKARQFPEFDLRMGTEATEAIREHGKVVGVRCKSEQGEHEVHADLVVAADGRGSTIRDATQHQVVETGVPIDALWFRLDKPEDDDGHTLAWLKAGHMLVTIPRRTHYQVAMVIRKGSFDLIKSDGIDAFRKTIGEVCPPLRDAASKLAGWDSVKLLTVQINHLTQWYEDGLLFIGDAAHAMSPMGGVGINLAIQDAVATANLLVGPLLSSTLTTDHLRAVQSRREPAARRTQRLQARMHAMLLGSNAAPDRAIAVPWYTRAIVWLFGPLLRRIAGQWIGMGFQPERIETKPADR